MNEAILYVSFAMIAGLILSRGAKLIHLPNVTGYLVAGLLIGPYILKILPADSMEGLSIITTVALGFIAFSIGGEFKFSNLKAIGKSCTTITFFQALSAAVLVDMVLIVMGFDLPTSLTLGAIATATAPAATLMVVRQYHAQGEVTRTLLPVVAMDDAVGLVVFSVSFAIAKAMTSGAALNFYSVAVEPLIEIVLSLIIGAAIGFVLAVAMRFFHSKSNRLCLCVAGVMLGVAIAEIYGLSDLLLCMAIGMALVNIQTKEYVEMLEVTNSWTPPLFMLFFVISGAELDLTALPAVGILGAAYILARSAGKYLGARVGAKIVGASPNIQKYLGITLLPQAGVAIGMAAKAVAELPPEYGAKIQAVALCATLIYELVGPVLTKMALIRSGDIVLPEKAAPKSA